MEETDMKRLWSPENATEAYFATLNSVHPHHESGVAELVSAMAAGWNARLIVETWTRSGPTAISVGLAVASRHTHGRHVCIVPDAASESEYVAAMEAAGVAPPPEVVIGDSEEAAVGDLEGIDFLVVDCRREGFGRVIRRAKLSRYGAVVVCKNAEAALGFRWGSVLCGGGSRVCRSVFLPVGKGLNIAHVGSGGGEVKTRWFRHVDQKTGELHVFRK